MSTMAQLKAAEQAMREARRVLAVYTERPSDQQDRDVHRRLAAEAKIAEETYVKTALELDSR
jgi:hypothetical protein